MGSEGKASNPRRSRWLALPLALAAIGIAAGCGGDDEETLTVYSGREEELVAPLLDDFSEQSDLELDVRYGDTAELASTILEEGDSSPADVFFGQDAGALGALEKEGRLARLDRSALSRVPGAFRSQDGRWVGTSGRARVVAFNSETLPESELPDSILDYTDSEWKGRIGWAPTNGSFQASVTAMRLTEGEQATERWLRGIVANDPVAFENNIAVRDAVASGEVDVGFINHYYVAQAREEEGESYPVRVQHPPGGDIGSLINVAGVGIVEGTDQSEEASEFVGFLLSPEAQRYFSEETKEYPLVEGIPADPTVTPLAEIEVPDVQLGQLDDLDGTLRLLQRTGAL